MKFLHHVKFCEKNEHGTNRLSFSNKLHLIPLKQANMTIAELNINIIDMRK